MTHCFQITTPVRHAWWSSRYICCYLDKCSVCLWISCEQHIDRCSTVLRIQWHIHPQHEAQQASSGTRPASGPAGDAVAGSCPGMRGLWATLWPILPLLWLSQRSRNELWVLGGGIQVCGGCLLRFDGGNDQGIWFTSEDEDQLDQVRSACMKQHLNRLSLTFAVCPETSALRAATSTAIVLICVCVCTSLRCGQIVESTLGICAGVCRHSEGFPDELASFPGIVPVRLLPARGCSISHERAAAYGIVSV